VRARSLTGRVVLVFAVLPLAVLALTLVGCGDDDDDGADGGGNGAAETQDAEAKAGARSMQTAIEVYATDNGGQYSGATIDTLREIEPTLPDNLELLAQPSGYELTVTSDSDTEFTIARGPAGAVTQTCEPAGEGGCPDSGEW
jgi:hypothetical protein